MQFRDNFDSQTNCLHHIALLCTTAPHHFV